MNSVEISTFISCIFGIIGSLLIIIIFLIFKEQKLFYRKLILVLSFYDLLQSISYILPGKNYHILCHVQMYAIAITGITSQYWCAAISFVSYLKVVKNKTDQYLQKLYQLLHISMLILDVLFILIVTFFGTPTKKETYWCWCSEMGLTMMMYTFYWIFMVICLVFYLLTIIKLRAVFKIISQIQIQISKEKQLAQFKIQLRMSLIPLIYIILLIPPTIKRVNEEIHPNSKSSIIINILQAIATTSHGFWDFLIFIVFVKEMRKKIRNCSSISNQNRDQKYSSIQDFETSNQFNEFHKLINSTIN
ncbi:g protein-coupled receptor [Anaeramoeba ignava]|uniref:G protein-coupled receptor n=1 Tax=Anaeramoeba ignava TaxID=1746090 RepID=A0A9Q0LE30_ANAIG|nr:g protein-coupled receptor [Anaeramoeba ignava]